MSEQQILPVQLRSNASFENYIPGKNKEIVRYLQEAIQEKNIPRELYLWGAAGSGRTHLLQASCRLASYLHLNAFYLDLSHPSNYSSEILQDLEQLPLMCLDDIENVAGDAKWEEALFHLYNRCLAKKTMLLISGGHPPGQAGFTLPDLISRLRFAVIYQVHELDDEEKIMALQKRAREKGFKLNKEVGLFLLTRCFRDMNNLMALLEKLDTASLAQQRRITIPFVKQLLTASD